jgi:hypothetical protein
VNENELYVYPEHSEFFAVFTSELYRVEDSSRYYYIISGTIRYTAAPCERILSTVASCA